MEVHHHTHDQASPHHKKNWKNYFWEFLMLFMAVFCGFLAEYQLEHKIEKEREIQYIYSLINDLKTDKTKLDRNLIIFQKSHLMQDTAIEMLPSLESGFKLRYYKCFKAFMFYPDFIYSDATIQQLKNSGGFRLIKNQKVVDRIMNYDANVKRALINEAGLEIAMYKTSDCSIKIFNQSYLFQQLKKGVAPIQLENNGFDFLLIHDTIILSQYANQLSYHSNLSKIVTKNMQEVKLNADELLSFLKKEYNIE